MTAGEVKRALAGADASALRPISIAGRVEDFVLALTVGIAPTRDWASHGHLNTFESNESALGGGGSSWWPPEVVCDAHLTFQVPAGKKRAKKLAKEYAAALGEACAGGSVDLQVAADVLREKGVSIRAVLAGYQNVKSDGWPDAKPSIEIKVHGSERRAQELVEQWEAFEVPRNAPHYGRSDSSGRLFLSSIVDKRYRAANDKALDAALAAMSR